MGVRVFLGEGEGQFKNMYIIHFQNLVGYYAGGGSGEELKYRVIQKELGNADLGDRFHAEIYLFFHLVYFRKPLQIHAVSSFCNVGTGEVIITSEGR